VKQNFELKVGLFVLGGLFLLILGIFFTKDVSFFRRYYTLNVEFEFAEGIKKFSPVRFSGVEIGQIKDVKVVNDNGSYKVLVTARVETQTKVPIDSRFFINSLGVLSEKYLEIIPGEKTAYLHDGQLVKGVSPIPLRSITESANLVIKKMQDFLEDAQFKDAFREFVFNMRDSSSKLKALLSDGSSEELVVSLKDAAVQFKKLLEDIRTPRGTIGMLLNDPSLYRNLEELSADLKVNPWKLLHRSREQKPLKKALQ